MVDCNCEKCITGDRTLLSFVECEVEKYEFEFRKLQQSSDLSTYRFVFMLFLISISVFAASFSLLAFVYKFFS